MQPESESVMQITYGIHAEAGVELILNDTADQTERAVDIDLLAPTNDHILPPLVECSVQETRERTVFDPGLAEEVLPLVQIDQHVWLQPPCANINESERPPAGKIGIEWCCFHGQEGGF
jgi:hypothetical protein